MRTKFYIMLIMTALISACGNQQAENEALEQMHDVKLYKQARVFNDYTTAISAAHSILVRDPSKTEYYDSLLMLYFESARYPQAVDLASYMLQKFPDNQKYLEVMARSFQSAGKYQQAEQVFKRLREVTSDPNYDYQLATMFFNAGDMKQAETYAQILLKTPKIDTSTVKLLSGQVGEQKIPLTAAIYNLIGSVRYRERNISAARDAFEKALSIDSSFYLAKENLSKLK